MLIQKNYTLVYFMLKKCTKIENITKNIVYNPKIV